MSKYKPFLTDEHIKFFTLFFGVFLASFLMLFMAGLVPSEISETDNGVIDDIRLNALQMASGEDQITYTDPVIETPKDPGETPIRLVVPNTEIDVNESNENNNDASKTVRVED